ncbi:hypothetical protein CROQUDRAFT_136492 [Cronartium quercuum f. sp. fusiforme G11]|uniref:Uncharacterized protein n=1 Tax=Cronartium quercuum f. sp. fusiforme G11 TaxID=708437 RepID=A0A9P6N6V8_9BASI|nr:hypothetical protein CROQUDRAFT_136492 [Cronartium quercuum f. sp. fusiforme G11]
MKNWDARTTAAYEALTEYHEGKRVTLNEHVRDILQLDAWGISLSKKGTLTASSTVAPTPTDRANEHAPIAIGGDYASPATITGKRVPGTVSQLTSLKAKEKGKHDPDDMEVVRGPLTDPMTKANILDSMERVPLCPNQETEFLKKQEEVAHQLQAKWNREEAERLAAQAAYPRMPDLYPSHFD